MMTEHKTFDPARYLTKVGSADYLEVKWRLVWLREAHPDARITTDLVSHDVQHQMAVIRAEVSIPGGGSATGYGSETYGDFREYLEKAETKAIGRALAALGFGTQFCPDHEFGGVVDAPVGGRGDLPPRQRGTTENTVGHERPAVQNPDAPPTPKQVDWLASLIQQKGWTAQMVDDWLQQHSGRTMDTITKGTASDLIDHLKNLRAENGVLAGTGNPDRYPR